MRQKGWKGLRCGAPPLLTTAWEHQEPETGGLLKLHILFQQRVDYMPTNVVPKVAMYLTSF